MIPSLKRVEAGLIDGPVGAHPVAAQPTGRGEFDHPRKPAVVGEQHQALGIDVEPPDGDEARQVRRQGVEDRRPPLGIAGGGDEAAGLVEQEKASALGRAEPHAVDPHVVGVGHVVGGTFERLAVHRHAASGDPGLRLAARAQARPRHHLGDAAAFANFRLRLGVVAHGLVRIHSAPAGLPGEDACPKPEGARSPVEKARPEFERRGVRWRATAEASDPMSVAFGEARAAEARGEAPIGAALVRDGVVVARAGNRTRELADPTAHAELLVIREAAAAIGSERLVGCDLYVTLEPCAMCAGAISHARIRRLYYAAPDPKGGAVDHGPRFFSQPTCHHAPEVYGGIRESEAAAMLRAFFGARR